MLYINVTYYASGYKGQGGESPLPKREGTKVRVKHTGDIDKFLIQG